MPREANIHVVGHAAEPIELSRVELALSEQWPDDIAARECTDDGPILGGHAVEITGGLDAARSRHVLHDHVGIAGKMPAHVTAENTGIKIIGTASGEADYDRNVFSLEC